MLLKIRNLYDLKEADVKLDGLTLIAGENSTGKSSVGKLMFAIINEAEENKANPYSKYHRNHIAYPVFGQALPDNLFVELSNSNGILRSIPNKGYVPGAARLHDYFDDISIIETPMVWNLFDLFREISDLQTSSKYELNIPRIFADLYSKIMLSSSNKSSNTIGQKVGQQIEEIIVGEFVKKSSEPRYEFISNNIHIPLESVASGIKNFGILQVLCKNGWINEKSFIVLDEPEVHLHPEWILKMAEVIVAMVKAGVRVLVNSHSPYMIEALIMYSRQEKIDDRCKYYLAKKDTDRKNIIVDATHDLDWIFETLAKPFRRLDQMRLDMVDD
ncbi:hypothetical protein AGMMS50229_09770 [Campylobacterota bacterium]|nr:hypothetical protein AGMMS50229_09770 [Campylobacterota bacterium]